MGVVAQVRATGGRVVVERRLRTQLLQAVEVVCGACGNGNEAGPMGIVNNFKLIFISKITYRLAVAAPV